jgi:hypothetical protein
MNQELQGFQKELYTGIPNVTVWRVLRKRLHLQACKVSIVQGVKHVSDLLSMLSKSEVVKALCYKSKGRGFETRRDE